ncbi:MAG TPA: hypothetical protein VIV11_00680 [Kofleriaceae bacterium]
MGEPIDRSKLLPRSGVGVVEHWLVIAPPGNPVIRIDLRGLDCIELLEEDETERRAATDRPEDWASNVILSCGDLDVGFYIADGSEAAQRIVREAAPMTREGGGDRAGFALDNFVLVGNDVVFMRRDYIQCGQVAFLISEVREYALRGQNIPLTGGRLLQAATALLVVAAEERDREAEIR